MAVLRWICIVGFLCSAFHPGDGSFGFELMEKQLENVEHRLSNLVNNTQTFIEAKVNNIQLSIDEKVTNENTRLSNLINNLAAIEKKVDILSVDRSADSTKISKRFDTLEVNLSYLASRQSSIIDRLLKLDTTGDTILSKQKSADSRMSDIISKVSTLEAQSKQILKNHFDLVIPSCDVVKVPGIYRLQFPSMNVFCERGKISIQQRIDGKTDFSRNWYNYKIGFGSLGALSEYWMGLEAIHQITNSGEYALWVYVQNDSREEKYAHYSQFKVSSESEGYKLTVGGYSGNAGDALSTHNNMKFSTFDKDNDLSSTRNCGQEYKSGWWFHQCSRCNLNGEYIKGSQGFGIEWGSFMNAGIFSQMMITRK